MSLQASFPFPETRFLKAGSYIYKVEIRGGSSYSREEVIEGHGLNQELEEIIRTVLGNLDCLQPFSSTNFNVFPYKKRWEGMSMVMCKHDEGKLRAYPFILILYLEKNMQNGKQAEKLSPEKEEAQQHVPSVSEPQSKRRKRDSPLEDAIIKDLVSDLEAESKVFRVGRVHMGNPHAEGKVKQDPGHADKKGTKGFNEPQEESDVNTFGRSSGEVPHGTTEDMKEEEEEEEEEEGDEGENVDSVPGSPERPGILTRLASHVFPFSLFFRDL